VATDVQMVGLAALARDVARAAAPGGALDQATSEAAATAMDPVASQTRSSVPTGNTGRLSGSVRVTRSRSGAAARMGDEGVLYAGPVEFGGWPEGRVYLANGRYLFPAGAPLEGSAPQLLSDALQRALDGFAWTNTTTNPESVHD
jgi:hypothetical protein